MLYQIVKYKLINTDTGAELWLSKNESSEAPAPKNWDESDKTLKRSIKTFGAYTELSKNLAFTKKGAEFLREAYAFKDIEARITVEEYWFKNDIPYLNSRGVLDFSEYESTRLEVKVPFKSGGLNAIIESQLKEKFELERLESINEKEINPLTKVDVALTGRKILLISALKNSTEKSEAFSMLGVARVPNLEVVSNSDEANISYTFGDDTHLGSATPTEHFFYLKSDIAKTIKVKVDYNVRVLGGGFNTVNFQPFIRRFSFDGDNYTQVQTYILNNPDGDYLPTRIFQDSLEVEIDLDIDDSLVFGFISIGGDSPSTGFTQQLRYDLLNITVTEDSEFQDSQTKAVLMHEAFDKTMQIITGEKDNFYSDFYGRTDLGYTTTGAYAYTGLALGFWIRQFNDKNIETSLSDLLDTSNTIHATTYGIEERNNKECLIVEDMTYFFQPHTLISLPNQVNNIKRSSAKEFAYSSLEFGYKDGGEYEEAMGLDEPNVRSGFVLPITRVDTKYSKLSPSRADAYAKEFARRKPKLSYPEEDTRYDKDIHLLDLKTGFGLALEERTWQDDYEVAPENLYSPETATNLRLLPSELERRHQWFYGACLTKFQDKKVSFSNSDGNRLVVTKKEGENARAENDNVNISELEHALFLNQWIEFEHQVDYDINQKIYGKTEINGRLIPNYYGKIEFINEFNKKEYGYLFEVKPNKKGTWKLLKAL